MFKKIALTGLIVMSSQLQVYAAGCDVPSGPKFKWNENKYCKPGSHCIIDWNGYGWWTNYHANKEGIWYGETGIPYDPRNVAVEAGKLKLTLRKSNLGGPKDDWTAGEATLVRDKDGKPMNIGYGRYLFTYELPVPTAQMDPSTVFGAFTYYRQNIGLTDKEGNDYANNLKELDMIEHSKWGWNGVGDCPFVGSDLEAFGCSGSAQFGTQPWKRPGNLKRFAFNSPDITNNEKVFTAYMYWEGAHKPVIYKLFTGKVDMETAKTQPGTATPDFTLTNTDYVPSLKDKDKNGADACVRFHFNFYSAINSSQWVGNNVNIYPKIERPISVYITNFEYQPN